MRMINRSAIGALSWRHYGRETEAQADSVVVGSLPVTIPGLATSGLCGQSVRLTVESILAKWAFMKATRVVSVQVEAAEAIREGWA